MKEYIEREALIARYDAEHVGPLGRARELMVTAPAADVVEVRHAKWVSSEQYNGRPECPVCFYVTDEKTNYCPNCGADIRERDKV